METTETRLGTPLTLQEADVLSRAINKAVRETWMLLHGYEPQLTISSGTLKTNDKPGAHGVCFAPRGNGDRAWFGITVQSQAESTAE